MGLVQCLRENVLILPYGLVKLLSLLKPAFKVLILTLELSNDTDFKLAFLDHLQETAITFLQLLVEPLNLFLLLIQQLGQVGHLR